MITNTLSDFKKEFDIKLNNFFETKIREAEKNDELSAEMIGVVKEFTMRGGKRIRPALVYYGYKCFSNNSLDEVMNAAISIELVQSFFLIHDDIIDNDDFRRGKPTVHKIYENKYDSKLGSSLAILTGDLAISFANEGILKTKLDSSNKNDALLVLNETVSKVIYGQELDTLSSTQKSFNEKDLFKIHNLKTAKYTFEGPLIIGATLAGADKNSIEILKKYSYNMGVAFQLQDDILGLFGDEKKLGKPIGSDIKEGKKTLLIIKAEEKCAKQEKETINKILGKKDVTKDEVGQIRKIVEKTGSLNHSKELIKTLLDNAKTEINKLKVANKDGKEFLIELIDYLENREY